MKRLLATMLSAATITMAQSGFVGGSDGIHQQNAKTLGQWGLVVGASGNLAADSWSLSRGGKYTVDGVEREFKDFKLSASGNLFVGLGVADNIDIGISLPLYYDRAYADDALDAITAIRPGDLNLWGKMKAPFFSDSSMIGMAGQIDLFIPTFAARDRGMRLRHAWYLHKNKKGIAPYSANEVAVGGTGIMSLDLTRINVPIRWNGNLGLVYVVQGNKTLVYGTGVNFVATDWLEPFIEYSGELRLEMNRYPRSPIDDPMLLTPGVRFHFPYNIDLALGVDVSARALANLGRDMDDEMDEANKYQVSYIDEKGKVVEYAYTPAPSYALTGLLTWRFGGAPKAEEHACPMGLPQDTTAADSSAAPADTAADSTKSDSAVVVALRDFDQDGVVDSLDQCPNTPSGIAVDSLGCPMDSDHDGVADAYDQCPETAADVQVGRNGCALDFDGDGVADNVDMCPNTKQGVAVDSVGCMLDADKDGVADAQDKCADTPAEATVDATGCPMDSDNDGVPDYLDKCPNTLAGVKIDANGCPVNKKEDLESLKKGIGFELNSAKLTKESFKTLDDIASLLKKIKSANLEVQGHTDNTGTAELNKKLSQERAKAVTDYLVSKGVEANRLRAVGYGPDKPIGDNNTDEGRSKNRRVELVPYSNDGSDSAELDNAVAQ